MDKRIFFIPLLAICLTGCNQNDAAKGNSFIELKDNEVLYIGNGNYYRNSVVEDLTETSIYYNIQTDYVLHRSSFNTSGSVYYNGYYYYWTSTSFDDTYIVGYKKTTITTIYSYLKYGQQENIVVRTKTKREVTYDYYSGMHTFRRDWSANLNGYFDTIIDMRDLCPDLYLLINTSDYQKIYVSATETKTYSSSNYTYNTYFYIETI